MARERSTRQPEGPGRSVRRPRSARASTTSQPAAPIGRPGVPASPGRPTGRTARFRDIGFTRRALILVGVLAILALSYANSLRIMLNQQRDLATANAQIQTRSAQLADLDAQLQRWRDPAYVKSQAREQLGWVLPGETGYRVIGTDGKVIDDAGATAALAGGDPAEGLRWWDRVAASVVAADSPTAKR